MPARQYFFRSVDNRVLGPVNINVVVEMIQNQKVRANTPISTDGANFKPMKSFPELATLLSVDVGTSGPEMSADEAELNSPPTYSGDLQEVSIPKLLFHFTASKVSGLLALVAPPVEKELYFTNGKVVAVISNSSSEALGQYLIRNQVLSAEQMSHIHPSLLANDQLLGDHLIHRGLLKPGELFEQIKANFLEKISDVFTWRSGQYAFFDGKTHRGATFPMNSNPWEILVDGVRSGYSREELKPLLLPYKNRVILAKANPHIRLSDLTLHAKEAKVFKSASNQRTLATILDETNLTEEDQQSVLQMIYLGLELDLLELGEEVSDSEFSGDALDAGHRWDEQEIVDSSKPAPTQSADLHTTPPISAEEQRLLEILNQMRGQDYFTRLGLERSARAAEINKAFLKAARTYHPDNISANAPEQIRELTSEVFSLLNEAQRSLSSDDKRQQYLAALDSGQKAEEVDVSNVVRAEMLFQQGELFLKSRKFAQAQELFDESIQLSPEEGEFYIYSGYCAFCAKPNAEKTFLNQCIQKILKGLKLRNNAIAIGYYFLGLIYKRMDDSANAQSNFKKALSLEPNNSDVQRELRLMNMRDEKKSGFWKKK